MILFILIIAVFCFIYFNVIPKKRYIYLAWLSLFVTIFSVFFIVAHDHNHFGMKEKIELQKSELTSSITPEYPILLYQPLGNGTEKIYLYKTNKNDKKLVPIKTENMKSKISSGSSATITIKTRKYIYKNKLSKIMFGIFNHNNELKNRTYLFTLPKKWKVMSVKQAKEFQKKLTKKQILLKKVQSMQHMSKK